MPPEKPILYAPGAEGLELERCIRQSALKVYALKSPYHCWREHYAPPDQRIEKSTDAMSLGTLAHCMVLEPAELPRRYRVEPPGGKRNSGDGLAILLEFYAALLEHPLRMPEKAGERKTLLEQLETQLPPEIQIVTDAQFGSTRRIHAAVWAKERAAAILGHPLVMTEVTVIWIDPETGAECRATFDICIPPCAGYPTGLVGDLKKTVDASAVGFIGGLPGVPAINWRWCQVRKLRMHWQADFYRRGFQQVFRTIAPPVFVWIGVEEPATPETVGLYAAAEWMCELARREYLPALEDMIPALLADVWPGYSDDFVACEKPEWMEG